MATIVTRAGKGSALTHNEVDANFNNLNNDKVEKSGTDPVVISVNSSSDALRITQTGAGNALVVEDSANPDSSPFVVDASGNVGIGVTPSAGSGKQLEVGFVGNSIIGRAAAVMDIAANVYYNAGYKYATNAAASMYQQGSGAHLWYNATSGAANAAITFTQAMTLDASGDLGIGITSPTSRLHLKGTAGSNPNTNGIVFQYSASTANFGAIGLDNASGDFVIAAGSGASTRFYTNSDLETTNERMRITSAGEVLVGGTTSVNAKQGSVTVESTTAGTVNLVRNDTTVTTGEALGELAFFGNDTTSNTRTNLANIQALASSDHAAGDNPTDLVFGTTPDGSATRAEAGRITQSGAYVLKGGTTTAAAGVGIIFPASQVASANANCLDDYEEGDWTPTFGGSSSDPTGVAYVVQRGKYTKIGNLVNLNFYLAFSTYTGGSGAIYIKGVPFGASGDGDGAIKIENVTLSAGRTYATVTAGSSFIFPQQSGSATTWISMTIGTAFTSSATVKYFTGSITYMV